MKRIVGCLSKKVLPYILALCVILSGVITTFSVFADDESPETAPATITLDAATNGGTVNGEATLQIEVTTGSTVKPADTYTTVADNSKFSFVGWSTDKDALVGELTVTPSGGETYYAIFREVRYVNATTAATTRNGLTPETPYYNISAATQSDISSDVAVIVVSGTTAINSLGGSNTAYQITDHIGSSISDIYITCVDPTNGYDYRDDGVYVTLTRLMQFNNYSYYYTNKIYPESKVTFTLDHMVLAKVPTGNIYNTVTMQGSSLTVGKDVTVAAKNTTVLKTGDTVSGTALTADLVTDSGEIVIYGSWENGYNLQGSPVIEINSHTANKIYGISGNNKSIKGDMTLILNDADFTHLDMLGSATVSVTGNVSLCFDGVAATKNYFYIYNNVTSGSNIGGAVNYIFNNGTYSAQNISNKYLNYSTSNALNDTGIPTKGYYKINSAEGGIVRPVNGADNAGKFQITTDYDYVLANGEVVLPDENGYYDLSAYSTVATYNATDWITVTYKNATKVNFVVDGEIVGSSSGAPGTAVDLIEAPEKENSKFLGWAYSQDAVVPDNICYGEETITVYAVWLLTDVSGKLASAEHALAIENEEVTFTATDDIAVYEKYSVTLSDGWIIHDSENYVYSGGVLVFLTDGAVTVTGAYNGTEFALELNVQEFDSSRTNIVNNAGLGVKINEGNYILTVSGNMKYNSLIINERLATDLDEVVDGEIKSGTQFLLNTTDITTISVTAAFEDEGTDVTTKVYALGATIPTDSEDISLRFVNRTPALKCTDATSKEVSINSVITVDDTEYTAESIGTLLIPTILLDGTEIRFNNDADYTAENVTLSCGQTAKNVNIRYLNDTTAAYSDYAVRLNMNNAGLSNVKDLKISLVSYIVYKNADGDIHIEYSGDISRSYTGIKDAADENSFVGAMYASDAVTAKAEIVHNYEENADNGYWLQGGTTDGEYMYYSYFPLDSYVSSGKITNESRIIKIPVSEFDGKKVSVDAITDLLNDENAQYNMEISEPIYLGHANDMTYYDGKIIVANCTTKSTGDILLSIVDAKTLTLIDTVKREGSLQNVSYMGGIEYCESERCFYVVRDLYLLKLDMNFNLISEIKLNSSKFKYYTGVISGNTTTVKVDGEVSAQKYSFIRQGCYLDENFIYYVNYANSYLYTSDGLARGAIIVFDHSGNYVRTIFIPEVYNEPEFMCKVGDDWYLGYLWSSGTKTQWRTVKVTLSIDNLSAE